MLDVRDPRQLGLGRGGDPDRVRAQRALDPPRDDRVLFAVARVAQQLLAEVRVDGGVGAAPRSRRRARACETRWPSRRTSSSGLAAISVASPRPAQKTKQDGNSSRSTPNIAGRVVRRAARGPGPRARARSSHPPRADQLDGARDRLLVVLGRHRAEHLEAARRRRVEQRQRRRRAARRRARAARRAAPRRRRRAATSAHSVSAALARPRRATRLTSGTTRQAGAEAAPVRRLRRRRARREAADGDRPGGCGPSAGSAQRPRRQLAPALGELAKRCSPRGAAARPPRRGRRARAPPRSGCSKQNHGSPGRREAQTTAAGSTLGGQLDA